MKHARWWIVLSAGAAALIWSAGAGAQASGETRTITEADCTAAKLGDSIPVSAIGEPVSGVTLSAPRWNPPGRNPAAWCSVNGVMAPVDHAANGQTDQLPGRISFHVERPRRAVGRRRHERHDPDAGGRSARAGLRDLWQRLRPSGKLRQRPAESDAASDDWALNEEAIRNLGYMQLKKTHDAAMVLIERLYGRKPEYNYFVGTSQGGREALTVAERYPNDYNGIAANVPIVGFSSLMLGPALIRIHEKPQANWITSAKINAIRGEFMRQCDKLDGLVDGIINNYMACRETFDVKQGKPNRHPWAAKRCPNNMDPESRRYQRGRVSHRWPDLHARIRLQPLFVFAAAGERREDFRNVAAQYRPQRQRPDRQHAFSQPGRRGRKCAALQLDRRAGRHGLPDAGPPGQCSGLRRRRQVQRATPGIVGDPRFVKSRLFGLRAAAAAK